MDWAIKTENLGKVFWRQRFQKSMFRLLKTKFLSNGQNPRSYVALSNVNVEVRRGERIAVIGNNGAGKTTFLKLLARLYVPSEGRVYVKGDVKLLAGLGGGMIDDLSVEGNVYLYGAIYGLDRAKIREKFADIIEWAELEEFIHGRLRTLSSGMRARLAFSTVRHIEADILLMDEALSAGDRSFKKKCEEVLESYKYGDRTLVIATHDVDLAKKVCSKTLWLDKGRQAAFGETDEVVEQYLERNN